MPLHSPFAIFEENICVMTTEKQSPRIPGWFKILILVTASPLFAWPLLMSRATDVFTDSGMDNTLPWTFVMLLPLYVVLSTWISYRVYATRKEVAWILQGLQILVYLAMFILVL